MVPIVALADEIPAKPPSLAVLAPASVFTVILLTELAPMNNAPSSAPTIPPATALAPEAVMIKLSLLSKSTSPTTAPVISPFA
ncbi:hypothetical protein D3C73_646500 [compost metagenome]